jgi:hypothetical protein
MIFGLAQAGARAGDYTYLTENHSRGTEGDNSYGLATGVLVAEQKLPAPPLRFRPIVWFGAVKPIDGKSQFLYLMIFKTPPDFAAESFKWSFDSRGSSDTGAEGKMKFRVGTKKAVDIAYKIATDPKSHVLRNQSLTVDGREVQKGDPRVFVVDLTGRQATCTAVKVALPKNAPDVGASNRDDWGRAIDRAVDQLKNDSPESKRLLDVTK